MDISGILSGGWNRGIVPSNGFRRAGREESSLWIRCEDLIEPDEGTKSRQERETRARPTSGEYNGIKLGRIPRRHSMTPRGLPLRPQ